MALVTAAAVIIGAPFLKWGCGYLPNGSLPPVEVLCHTISSISNSIHSGINATSTSITSAGDAVEKTTAGAHLLSKTIEVLTRESLEMATLGSHMKVGQMVGIIILIALVSLALRHGKYILQDTVAIFRGLRDLFKGRQDAFAERMDLLREHMTTLPDEHRAAVLQELVKSLANVRE